MSIYLFSPEEIIERKFRILATLGRGSFSQVYKAEDLVMSGICVLKVLQPVDDAIDSLQKLREEANIYRKLGKHKHIARLLDVNKFAERDDLLYLKLEYIEGQTIETRLRQSQQRREPPPPILIAEIRQIILDLLEALDFMHTRSEPILHRDIKPSNLILSPTRGLVVVDFNVSKELVAGENAQTLVGTLPYIPPEIISRGTDWDVSSDLYAVGVLFYKMLTNEDPPFATRNGSSSTVSFADFPDILSSLPENVIGILNRAIAYDRQDRFQSAKEMMATIEKDWPVEQVKPVIKEVKKMSIESISHLEADEQQIKVRQLLHNAKSASADNQFLEAGSLLAEAAEIVGKDKALLAEYETAKRNINIRREQRVSQLAQEITTLLNANKLDEQQITLTLTQLDALDTDRAQKLQAKYADKQKDQREEDAYLNVLSECESLWRRADELIAASTPYENILSQMYVKAVQIAEQAFTDKPTDKLEGLVIKAKAELEQARQKFNVLSTGAETGAYEEMMDVLNREKDENKSIQVVDGSGHLLGTMPVREARREVERMAYEFAHHKAMGYLDAAKIHMEAHAPRVAKDEIEKYHQLFRLGEDDEKRLQNYLEKEVEPELTRFQLAQDFLEKARHTANITESWNLVDKAYEQYPWLTGFEEIRAGLIPSLKAHVEDSITQLSRVLNPTELKQRALVDHEHLTKLVKDAKHSTQLVAQLINHIEQVTANIGQVQQKADEMKRKAEQAKVEALSQGATDVLAPEAHAQAEAHRQLAKHQAQLAEATLKRVEMLQELLPDLQKLYQQAQSLHHQAQTHQQLGKELTTAAEELSQLLITNPGAAGTRWQALVTQYGIETVESFPVLNQLARDLDARLNIKGLIARLEQDFASNEPERIIQAIAECEKAVQDKKNLDHAPELATLRGRLESRRAYLVGQSHMEAGDANKALVELKKVTVEPDAKQAKKLVADIEQKLANDEKVKQVLDKSIQLLSQNPRQAYETLKPYEETLSRYHEAVMQQLTESRGKWEDDIVQRLQDGLNQTLDEDKVEELRNLEKDLRVELGVSGNRLAKQVLAHCFAYEAKTSMHLKSWDEAITQWEQAVQFERKPEYVEGLLEARKQHARYLTRETPESAITIIKDLQKEIYDDPDLQHWAAELYIQQAQNPNSSSADAERHYKQALEELSIGLKQMENRAGTKEARLKGQLNTLSQKARTGLEVEKQKQQIERRLSIKRTVQEFHDARREGDALLKANPHYPRPELPTLPDWWQAQRQTIITQLETEVNKIPADQIWKRFEPLSKILALDEGHSQANGMFTQIPTLVRGLEREVENLSRDMEGLAVQAGSELDVLSLQIEGVQTIQQRMDAVYATLNNFSQHSLLATQSGTALATLNTISSDLLTTQRKLDHFQQLKNQAQSLLAVARGSGDWSLFDNLIDDIGKEGFASHRTTVALRRQRRLDEQRRKELQNWSAELTNRAQEGNFIAALKVADRFKDKETGDPNDEFGVQKRIHYQDPVTGLFKQGLRQVQVLLETKAQQLTTLHEWLLKCGLRELSKKYELVFTSKGLADAPLIINWSQHKESYIIPNKEKGKFDTAITLCERVDQGNAEPNTLSLTEAIRCMNEPPIVPAEVESQLAQTLLTEVEQKKNSLKADQLDVKKTIQWLNQQKQAWEDAWNGFITANARLLQTKKQRNPIGKANAIEKAASAYNNALNECVAICPQHPDLQGIKRSDLL